MNNIEKIWNEICYRKELNLDSFLEWFHGNYSIIDIEKDCCDVLSSYLLKNDYTGDPSGIIRWSSQAATDTNVFSILKTLEEIVSLSEKAFKHLNERMINNSLMNSNEGFDDAFHAYVVYAICKQPFLVKEVQTPTDSQDIKSSIQEDLKDTPIPCEDEIPPAIQRQISGAIFWPVFILFVFICLLTAFFIADSFGHDMETAKYFACAGIICAWGCKDSLRNLLSDFNKNNLWDFCSVFIGGIIGTALLCYIYSLMDSWGYGGALGWFGALFFALVLFGILIGAFIFLSKISKKGNKEQKSNDANCEECTSNDIHTDTTSKEEERNDIATEKTTTNVSPLHTQLSLIRYKKILIPICAIGLVLCGYFAYINIRPAKIPETVYLDSKYVLHIDRKCNNARAVYSIDSNELFKTYKGQSMMMCTRCVDNKTAALIDQKLKRGDN